jgi:hypothetical protein
VKPSYPPFTTTTAEGYSVASLIVSPTMEFKGLSAGPPPLDNNFVSGLQLNSVINWENMLFKILGAYTCSCAIGTLLNTTVKK